MATIRPRKNKHGKIIGHQAIVRRVGFPPQSKVFKRYADANAWAAIIESEMERGEFIDRTQADRLTLAEGLEDYKAVTERKRGKKQELVRIAYWQRHKLGKAAIGKIKPKDFAQWRDEELKAGKSNNTVRIHFSLISHFYRHARKEWGIPVQNPIADVWRPSKGRNRKRRYKPGEEERLLAAAAAVDALLPRAIIALTETAMRRTEFVTMAKTEIDLDRRAVHLVETKNDNPRDIPLSDRALGAYRGLPARIDGKVWPWTPEKLSSLFAKARKLAGIENFRLNDLRHEATSRLATIYEAHELVRIRGDLTMNQVLEYYHPTVDELAAKLVRA